MNGDGHLPCRRWCGRVGAAIAVAIAAACIGEADQGGPGPVPYHAQARSHSCLVAASRMVLGAFGVEVSEDRLWHEVRSWGEGTTVFEVQEALARRDFEGHAFRGSPAELAAIVRAGYPLIAVVGWPQKHAIVVAGSDPARGTLRLHDPKVGGPEEVDAATFDQRWDATGREAFLILPAGDRRLARAGVELDRIAAESGRARATELALRALLHSRGVPDAEEEALATSEGDAEVSAP